MQAINRQYGRITHKGAGEDAKANVLIQDYANSEQVLTQIIDASKHWRDAWVQTLASQVRMVESFAELYNPVVGSSGEGSDRDHVLSSDQQLSRTANLVQAYTELRDDLLHEVRQVDSRIIKPANEALAAIKPIKKTIKNRETKRLDYDGFVDKLENKRRTVKTEKDEMAVLKLETDVHRAADDFQAADQHLKQTLPPIIASTFSLLPHLLATLTSVQTSLLAQYYTTLHNFCLENHMPSPPPPVEDILGQWEHDFTPIQQEVENQRMIRTGKAILMPLHPVEDGKRQGTTLTGMNLRNRSAAAGSGLYAKGKTMAGRGEAPPPPSQPPHSGTTSAALQPGSRTPSYSYNQDQSQQLQTPSQYHQENRAPSRQPSYQQLQQQQQQQQQEQQSQPPQISYSSRPQYQEEEKAPAYNHIPRPQVQTQQSANSIAAKKKPPPPPPMKRGASRQRDQFVTAIYEFAGQEAGDLSFREGDKIKVIKKTESTDDWWDGELNGVRGRFPANYVEL